MDVSAGGELLAQATLGDAATGVRATGVPGPSPGASPVTLDAGYGADPSGDVHASVIDRWLHHAGCRTIVHLVVKPPAAIDDRLQRIPARVR